MIKDREFITKHISDVEPKGNSVYDARKGRASLQSESCRIDLYLSKVSRSVQICIASFLWDIHKPWRHRQSMENLIRLLIRLATVRLYDVYL